MISELRKALKMFLFMTLLTGLAYPLLITSIAQLTMPKLANGSVIEKDGKIIGSILISQSTSQDRYFWPRPSAINYDPMKPSGGSNLGPTSKKLKDVVEERKNKLGKDAPSELLYASGSGLDPHISLDTAYFQISRIAKTRSINKDSLKELVDSLTEGKQLGFLGTHYVNVLLLNQKLDEHQ